MTKIPETFNFGDTDEMTIEELVIKIQRLYTDLAEAVNNKPDLFERDTDGLSTDTFLANGTININSTTEKVEMLTGRPSIDTVTWKTLS